MFLVAGFNVRSHSHNAPESTDGETSNSSIDRQHLDREHKEYFNFLYVVDSHIVEKLQLNAKRIHLDPHAHTPRRAC